MPKTQTFLSAAVPLRQKLSGFKAFNETGIDLAKSEFKTQVGGKHDVSNLKDSFYFKAFPSEMFGVGTVRDLAGNNHFVSSASNMKYAGVTRHVEDWLQDQICLHYKKGSGLTQAKVSIYMPKSPCQQCTKSIGDWVAAMRKAVTKDDASQSIFFVFNFKEYYLETENGDPDVVWPDETAAINAYDLLTAKGTTTSLPNGKGGSFKVPVINFRKASTMENGAPRFAGLAGKVVA